MDRVNTDTKAENLFGAGKHGFKDGDLPLGIVSTDLNAEWFNNAQEELLGIIEGAGLVPNAAVRTQLAQALQRAGHAVAVAGGTANALTASFTPAITALPSGAGLSLSLKVFVRAAAANTLAATTFAADGTPAKTIVKGNNLPLVAGDIAGAGHWLQLQFDPTLDKWVLLNPAIPFGFVNSITTNGYQKLSGGLIVQWGAVVANSPATAASFPIAFPNNVLALAASTDSSGGTVTSSFPTVTASGFTCFCATGALSTRWIALGF